MNVIHNDWCKRCECFHREGTLIWEEHKRYYDTRQEALVITEVRVK